jgi:hypothetical protein
MKELDDITGEMVDKKDFISLSTISATPRLRVNHSRV